MKDLSLHILDIMRNSIEAGANRIELVIEENRNENLYSISVQDNGRGMDEQEIQKALDPFYTTRTTRKVGLGLPLFRQNTLQTGGTFEVISSRGKGTLVKANFRFNHIDRPPLGDIEGTIALTTATAECLDFQYRHVTPQGNYTFSSMEVKEIFGDLSLNHSAIISALKELISGNLKEIAVTR